MFTPHYHYIGTPLQNASPGFLTFRSRGQQNKASLVATPQKSLKVTSLECCCCYVEKEIHIQCFWMDTSSCRLHTDYILSEIVQLCQFFDTFILPSSPKIDSWYNCFSPKNNETSTGCSSVI